MDFRYELCMHRYTHPETGVSINAEDMPWELKPEPIRVESCRATIHTGWTIESTDAGKILPGYIDRSQLDLSKIQVGVISADKLTLREMD